MNRNLCTGLISPSSFLLSLLDSIGIWYEEIDFEKDLFSNYSTLIYEGSKLTSDKKHQIFDFLSSGGCLLEISLDPSFFKTQISKSFSKTVFNSSSQTEFDRISYLDIYSEWASSDESDLFSGLIDFQKHKSDSINIGFIGLDLSSLPVASDYTRKQFISPFKVLPDEIVNKVSRDSLNDILELSLQKLFLQQKLPFIKKWNSPEPNPVFGFRIDSDFGSKESLTQIYRLLNSCHIQATWFLHVQEHEEYLSFFKSFNNQEIALHGYKHGYSSSASKIRQNIETGLNIMKQEGLKPNGFCTPYGIWNSGLEKVLSDYDFNYTSEFTTGYDCTPFFIPESEYLQIAVHPVCTGSLSRKGYSEDQMEAYFFDIYEQRKNLFKPIFLYHHPMQKGLNLFQEVFERANSDNLTNITFDEYANFWRERNNLEFSASFNEGEIQIESNNPNQYLYITTSANKFDLIPSKTQRISKTSYSSFKYAYPSLPSFVESDKLHNNPLNLIKTNFLDWKNRQRL
ncbi:MAG: DUF2334 domain-containing protein [Balneola sp.]|nr:DUF2334 domain-containing protein [Balneola sp.]MBO6650159.1 DUF2334 domain-containing protein [Balneola sp.]MBO6710523.1 DUF2334 domain-containing protein [Balneola sp.]MBO6799208.1 DUF2334 domain-containing protein [Balneola sp.]MBO6871047.1 DUF2334 domain-containing protein [Balneola sp.]